MHVGEFDLNLLHVFDAVHSTGNVGRAAERVGLSQPAVSHALTRLRLALKDPLFVRAPGGVRPTPRAEQFAGFVQSALRSLDLGLQQAEHFDAAQSQRRFTLHMSDLATAEFLPLLMRALRRDAPGVQLEALQLAPAAIGPALEEGRLDLAFGWLPQLAGAHRQDLLAERYVLLLREDHPQRPKLRGRAGLRGLDFVVVKSHEEPARALQRLGLQSRIRLTVPHFSVVPALLAQTDLAVIMPARPARRFAAQGGLAVVEAELGLPPITIAMHWTWRAHHDPGHRWLRETAAALLAEPPPATTGRARR